MVAMPGPLERESDHILSEMTIFTTSPIPREDEERGGDTLGFGVFAQLLNTEKGIVLCWEWEDGGTVQILPADIRGTGK